MKFFCHFGQKRYFCNFFLIFFRNCTLFGAEVFCVVFSSSRRFFWAIKTVFGQFFKFLIIKGVEGSKNYRTLEKRSKKFWKKTLNQRAKWNRKMGGKRFGHHMRCFHGHSTTDSPTTHSWLVQQDRTQKLEEKSPKSGQIRWKTGVLCFIILAIHS